MQSPEAAAVATPAQVMHSNPSLRESRCSPSCCGHTPACRARTLWICEPPVATSLDKKHTNPRLPHHNLAQHVKSPTPVTHPSPHMCACGQSIHDMLTLLPFSSATLQLTLEPPPVGMRPAGAWITNTASPALGLLDRDRNAATLGVRCSLLPGGMTVPATEEPGA